MRPARLSSSNGITQVSEFRLIERESHAVLVRQKFNGEELVKNMQLCKENIHFLRCWKSHQLGELEWSRINFLRLGRGQEATCKILFSCTVFMDHFYV